jgi:hypothetical protein
VGQDYLALVYNGINQLLGQHASMFESMGMNLFRAFALIIIVWFGLQSALAGTGFNWARFSGLLQELLFVYVMLAFYTVPIPGFGVSFTDLVLNQVQFMVAQLDQSRVQQIMETLNTIDQNLPFPTPYELLQIVRFFIIEGCVIVAQAVTLAVVMFGYVATAVIVLLGPLFIPFKIVPQMEWMFWGWFRAFIQFAFYQLVASAYVFVFGGFLTQFLGAQATQISASDMGYIFVPLVLTLVTFVMGMIKIPALTFSIFAGRAGEYVLLRWR